MANGMKRDHETPFIRYIKLKKKNPTGNDFMKITTSILSPRDGLNLALISHRHEDQAKWH